MTSQPFQPIPNVVQLVVQYNSANNICENVLHYTSGAAPTATTMNALIDAYVALEDSQLKALRTNNTFLQRVIARDMSTESGVIVDRQIIPTVVGVAANPQEPNNVTVAVAVRTGLGGRSFRGRIYHIGMSSSHVIGNALTASAQTLFASTYTFLLTLGVAPIFHLVVVSRKDHGATRMPAISTQATAITVDINLDSQRRRLNARGT